MRKDREERGVVLAMSEKPYTIDDIINEIKENKIDEKELARYTEDYQKYDTTALLDDVLGRKSDDVLDGIELSDSALTEEENKLLEQILKEEPQKVEESKPQQPKKEETPPKIKPLRPVTEKPQTMHFNPLQKTPAMAQGKGFEVHKDSVTGLISKVDIQKEAQRHTEEKSSLPRVDKPDKEPKPTGLFGAKKEKIYEDVIFSKEPAKAQDAEKDKKQNRVSDVTKPQIKQETVTPMQQIQHATFEAHTQEITQTMPSLSVDEPTIEATPFGMNEPTMKAKTADAATQEKASQIGENGSFSSVTTEIQGTPFNAAGVKTGVDLNDTAKLKYIALRKTRQSKVRDFSLETDYHKNNLEKDGKDLTEGLSLDVTPPPMKLPLIEDLTDELEREERENNPLFHVSKKKEKISEEPKRWEAESLPTDSEEEFVSYSQTDEIYDTLHELKHGMIFRLSASIVFFLLSIALVLLNYLPNGNPIQLVDPIKNPLNFCVINFIIMVLLCAFSFDTLRDGFLTLMNRKLNKTTLYSFALTMMTVTSGVILVDAEMVNHNDVSVYIPVMALCMAGWYAAKVMNFSRVLRNFHFVSGKTDKYSANILTNPRLAEDFTKGALNNRNPRFVMNRKTPFLSDFLRESLSRDVVDMQSKYVVPTVLAVSIIAAVAAFLLGGNLFTSFTVLSGILIVGAGITSGFVCALPLSQAQNDLSRMGGVVLGYHATESYADTNAMLISANDLFRPNDVTLYGIKTFSNMAIDRAILDATSVLCETKSILGGIFLNIISDRKDYLDSVDTLIYEDGMGISAWIKDRRVLIGSRELMINHNIDVPSRDYESRYLAQNRNLIYLSAAGELSAVFVVGVKCNEESRNMLVDLYNHDITAVIKTVDPILTKTQLAEIFDMPEDAFRVIPSRLHKEEEILADSEHPLNGGVSNNGTFPAYLYSVLTAKLLHRKINLLQLVNYAALGLGVLLFIAFTALKSVSQLTPAMLCVYEGAWLVILWGVCKLKKLIS